MRMIAKAGDKDAYFELVKEFPLVTIKNEKQFDEAVAFLKKLAIRGEGSLSGGEAAYLDALTLFVEDYQNKHHGLRTKRMKPLESLKYLMSESSMTPADLGRIIHSASLASQILKGNRELSKSNIIALSAYFKVAPGLFLQS
jgi:HTH-type transcriptional regulator/antitoxin HigA